MAFVKATKKQARLRMAFTGPAGYGKTYTALAVASGLAKAIQAKTGKPAKIALIDTERGSASKYAAGDGPEDPTKGKFDFDAQDLSTFNPKRYIEAIHEAERAGYDILVIDSLSHAWSGKGGILEYVDEETAKSKSKSSFSVGWRAATPLHNELVDAILQSTCHVLVTMRTKTEFVLDGNTPKKVGMAAVQRDGMDYEFDIVGDLVSTAKLHITKTRCPALTDELITKPGADLAEQIMAWLSDGAPVPVAQPPAQRPTLAAVPNNQEPADIPTGEPTEAEKIAAWFSECDNLEAAQTKAADLNKRKVEFGADWAIIANAAGPAIKRLKAAQAAAATQQPAPGAA